MALSASVDAIDWPSRFPSPRRLPPFAWCNGQAMGVAVPARKRSLKLKPDGTITKETSDGPFDIYPVNSTLWLSGGNDCRSGAAPIFFKDTKKRKAAAFLGETQLDACGTSKVSTDERDHFWNIFRPPTNPAVLVTCTCAKNQKHRCHPSARWLSQQEASRHYLAVNNAERYQHIEEQDADLEFPNIMGFALPIRSVVGRESHIQVISTDDKYVFQFQVVPSSTSDLRGTPWPRTCTIQQEELVQPLFVSGCPVSHEMNLRVHETTSLGTTLLSMEPFAFEQQGLNPMKMQCEIDLLSISAVEALSLCTLPAVPDSVPTLVDNSGNAANGGFSKQMHNAEQEVSRRGSARKTHKVRKNHDAFVGSKTRSSETLQSHSQLIAATSPRHWEDTVGVHSHVLPEAGKSSYPNSLRLSQAPLRRLQNTKKQQKKVEIRAPLMAASPLNARTSNVLGGKDILLERMKAEEAESRSRLNILQQAVEDGDFDGTMEAIVRAETLGATRVEDMKRTTEQLLSEPFPLRSDQVIPQIFNQYVMGPWAVNWGANTLRQSAEVGIANGGGYGFGGLSKGGRVGFFGVGTRGNMLDVAYDESKARGAVGFAHKRYGVTVDRSNEDRVTAAEVRARGTDIVSLVDFLDRVVGQRVGIRNFGLQMRIDIDDILEEGDLDFGDEFFFQYKTIAVGLGLDVLSARYIVGIGMMGVNVAVARDFNAYATNLQINWGRGWQIFVEADFPDDIDRGVQEAIGIGKPGRMYVVAGSGIGPDNFPVLATDVHVPRGRFGIGILEKATERLVEFSITVGRFTYLWETILLPDNLPIPFDAG